MSQQYTWRNDDRRYVSNMVQSNPEFIWPSAHINPHLGKNNSTKLSRGYMRILTDALSANARNTSFGNKRLIFQFNPDTITRQVAARNDIQYWMNMDPFQLTQPVPGSANFAFEMLFNREAEVNSSRVALQSEEQLQNEANLRNPALVGVFADLYMFDQIVGQGISGDLINSFLDNASALENRRRESARRNPQEETTDDGDTEEPLEPLSEEEINSLRENLQINIGNSAFLVANPIRIVFSPSFMV